MQGNAAARENGRDAMFDNLKGILMVLVVYAHVYDNLGVQYGWLNWLRVGLLMVLMPLFLFISGYFGKKLEKRRAGTLEGCLLPFLIFNTLFYLVSLPFDGGFTYNLLTPLKMYWFLVALMLYRLLLPELSKIRGLFVISIVVALIVGVDPNVGRVLSLSRAICFFPFYLMGIYCSKERMDKLRRTPPALAIGLFVACTAAGVLLGNAFDALSPSNSHHPYHMVNCYWDQSLNFADVGGPVMRASLYVLAPLMCLVFLSCTRSKVGIFTAIGRNSMAVYLFHAFPQFILDWVVRDILHIEFSGVIGLVIMLAYSYIVARILAVQKITDVYNKVMDRLNAAVFRSKEAAAVK